MNIKRGAIVAMVMSAIVMLGIIESVPGSVRRSTAGGASAVASSPKAPASVAASSAPELKAFTTPEVSAPAVKEAPLQLASAVSPAGLMEAVSSSAKGQLNPVLVDCANVVYSFTANPASDAAPLKTNLRMGAKGPNGESLKIWSVTWYFSAPNAKPSSTGKYTWVHEYTVPYNPELSPDAQTTYIGDDAHNYFETAGVYTVGMRIRFAEDEFDLNGYDCPVAGAEPYVRARSITVYDSPPAAKFEVKDLITQQDSMGLVPLNDWVPLFWMHLGYTPTDPAPRILSQLRFSLYGVPAIQEKEILEFGMFVDSGPEGKPDEILDIRDTDGTRYDGRLVYLPGTDNTFVIEPGSPMFTWKNSGYPYELPTAPNEYTYFDGSYNLSFAFNSRLPGFDALIPFSAQDELRYPYLETVDNLVGSPLKGWNGHMGPKLNLVIAGPDTDYGYIVAMRTSALLSAGRQTRLRVTSARMQYWDADPIGPHLGTNSDGDPVLNENDGAGNWFFRVGGFLPNDSYTPNFYEGKILEETNVGYSAQFDVYDLTGDSIFGYRPGTEHNIWNWPLKMYTPVAEHSRPRWDISNAFIDAMSGEWLDLRHIMPVDAWVPVLGINVHGSCTDQIDEINLVLTDIGGNPYGPPGNGGFNPNYALEQFTTQGSGTTNFAVQSDYSFNGAWLYYDTGAQTPCPTPSPPNYCPGDGIFTPPTPFDASGNTYGVSFTDFPMLPDFWDQGGHVNYGNMQWEYIPFPPGGGDPWWKIRLRFSGGRRRNATDPCTGYFESTPDYFEPGVPGTAIAKPDYFVVLHTDGGFTDVSGKTDGNGMIFGSDFRAFIEPRRWNPLHSGHWDGGILTTNMAVDRSLAFWQDTLALDQDTTLPPGEVGQLDPQPWWHERTHSQTNVKPQRTGFEVHDLVLTYSTDSDFGRETYIMHSQIPPAIRDWLDYVKDEADYDIWVSTYEDLFTGYPRRTYLSIWVDPGIYFTDLGGIGILNHRFEGLYNPGTQLDLSEGVYVSGYPYPNADELTSAQYAFETVPFEPKPGDELLDRMVFPRTDMYAQPFEQPTLPDYSTWPYRLFEGWGLTSIAYADADSLADNVNYFGQAVSSSNPEIVESWDGREKSYENDIYYFELLDGTFAGRDLTGYWLVDRNGGRFRIASNQGNVLTLEHGQAAYMDYSYNSTSSQPMFPNYPYGVRPGRNNAIARGAWAVMKDSMPLTRYPQMSDWPAGWGDRTQVEGPNGESRAARILRQHVEYQSQPTAMLGINLVGTDDPVVNHHSKTQLNGLTVAFWGPEFDPNDLSKLDSDTGYLYSSGVLLYEDTSGDGVFTGPVILDSIANPLFYDTIVPLEPASLDWPISPEPVDLDGDNIPDDMSGDGVVTDGLADLSLADRPALSQQQLEAWDGLSDEAWVLTLRPLLPWTLPQSDTRSGSPHPAKSGEALVLETMFPGATEHTRTVNWPAYWSKTPTLLELMLTEDMEKEAKSSSKALAAGGHLGDDLFVVIRTSETIGAFEQFRCVVPARLPDRTPLSSQFAGVSFTTGLTSRGACIKTNPDEGAVQDFYGHDMLEVSVPARVVDLSESLKPTISTPDGTVAQPNAVPVILPGGPPTAVLGIDTSANRLAYRIAYGNGDQAQATSDSFTPRASDIQLTGGEAYRTAQGWTEEVVGLYLIGFSATENEQDKRVEAYEITAVNGDLLRLRAGAPRNASPWLIVKDPTFLEQVLVEFYDASVHSLFRNFNPMNDFLPLNQEDPVNSQTSGVSLYRDNDWNPKNRNGVFDPPVLNGNGELEYIDLPVRLDDPPAYVGVPGEDDLYQVKFVFSSPGTDNSTGRDAGQTGTPYESQPRLRQWIPQCFGTCPSDQSYGPDFFVVVRTSRDMHLGDTFQAAIVSWGPDTPSEPDPDNFSNVYPTAGDLPDDQASLFSEFQWGRRGLGFITMFQDRPVYRHWAIDDTTRRPVAKAELDYSQDRADRRGLHWIRSNPAVHGRTQSIRSLPVPEVDFTADRHRQVVGGDVKFTLVATGSVEKVEWNFGDGETSLDRNSVHKYQTPGKYTVSVTVTDRYGIAVTETKREFIEVVSAPFVDFTAVPRDGTITPDFVNGQEPGLDVLFTDLSVGTDTIRPQAWLWTFGDNIPAPEASLQNPKHRYLMQGFYTVTLQVTFLNTATNTTVVACYQLPNYITVRPCIGCPSPTEGASEGSSEGTTEDAPAASFKIATAIRDKESLVPLTDWVPVLNFTMGYDKDKIAERYLRSLTYLVRPDGRKPSDLKYGNQGGPVDTDILEFGLFYENFADDAKYDRKLDAGYDYLLYTWQSTGQPVGQLLNNSPYGGMLYKLDFVGNGTASDPEFPVPAGLVTDNGMDGYSYFIAVRTSATWRSQLTLACNVLGAEMITPNSGVFPVDKEGKPVDSYEPNFYDGDILEPEVAYSSSFTAWDITGSPAGNKDVGFFDSWNHPAMMYTPLAEHTRPRWSKYNQLMDIMPGEMLSMRRLVSLDTWVDILGINVQSTKAVHADSFDPLVGSRIYSSKDAAQLREVNLVLTDIGGDPYGPKGNGGFNPEDGLDPVTTALGITSLSSETAALKDVTFNGAWVWHDTNNNGLFDPPTANEGGGVKFNGDYPMFPDTIIDFDWSSASELPQGRLLDWEYIPFPPGGGDPWWKIKMRFWGGRRRLLTGETEEDVSGYLEKTPDNFAGGPYSGSEYSSDYFVVVRTDSGFKDVSMAVPDQTGITMGADFRAFIEPRRMDSEGNQSGGIYLDSMIAPEGGGEIDTTTPPWQEDSRWGVEEPWWPQRTTNAKSAKPLRVGLDVHDLVLTYLSDSDYMRQTDLFFGDGSFSEMGCFGYIYGPDGASTDFDQWMDPFGLTRAQFLNGHTVGVTRWRPFGTYTFSLGDSDSINLTYDYTNTRGQFSYETVPFRSGDAGDDGRSAAYPIPLAQPTLPEYDTWQRTLQPGEYPRASQWAAADAASRLLTQKADIESDHTAILGINAVGSNDPVVLKGQEKATIASISVAFWGSDFSPDLFRTLDSEGRSYDSGVLLWEDANKDGVFTETKPFVPYWDLPIPTGLFDTILPVRGLAWGTAPEPIDLDGNGTPDDMNGDNVVDSRDYAWVLTLVPEEQWELPQDDLRDTSFSKVRTECGSRDFSKSTLDGLSRGIELNPENSAEKQTEGATEGSTTTPTEGETTTDTSSPRPGDDLFITARLSDKAKRFQSFRAVIPATLPGRVESQQQAGILFYPQMDTSVSAFTKSNPEEDPVQDFYGHDMLEVNVPVKIQDMTNQQQGIIPGGPALATVGIDVSTNRTDGTLLAGASGVGSDKAFTVPGAVWTAEAFAGTWLIDEAYEAYEIVGNTANQLNLFSGRPRDGRWRIVQDPTFLEQVILEFYNEGQDADFNPAFDLLPLDRDQELSGVALYRDNDSHPNNRNGLFDPGIDIPITLDAPPRFVGQTGESTQVKFVFSSPGTDDVPLPRDQQPRNRQWVPDTFGDRSTSPYYGPEFFVVVRASENMQERDNFRIGLVSWGPNTPTEPDPDTWASLPGEARNEFSKFEEFPWSVRGLGFITLFKNPQTRYFMDGNRAGRKVDNSGVNWLRSHTSKKRRSGIIAASPRPISPTTVIIESASQTELPSQTLTGQTVTVVLRGQHFGTNPSVLLTGYTVQILQATDTAISMSLSVPEGTTPQEPLVVIVRNPATNEEASRSNLFKLTPGSTTEQPVISGVQPTRGGPNDFPVTVTGRNFATRENVDVMFGKTLMPIISVSADGTSIQVGFPTGGLPVAGKLDVTVRNRDKSVEATMVEAFEYVSDAQRPTKTGLWGCAAGSPSDSSGAGDALVLLFTAAVLFGTVYRRTRKLDA